jgi:serine phosphatase RsbU (regulator of sigma subunit)
MRAGRINFSSLRVRLLAVVLLSVGPALVLTVFNAAGQRRIALEETQSRALRVARSAATKQRELIESTRQLLMVLSRVPDLRGHDSLVASRFLADLLEENPIYLNFGVIETNGDVFASGYLFRTSVNLGDRGYFQRALTTKHFSIGEYQIGRIHSKPCINFALPITDRQGDVVRVVYASLNLDWIRQVTEEASLPKGATMLVLDRTGCILFRHPDPEHKWTGVTADRVALVKELLMRRGEGVMRSEGLERVMRLYGYVALQTEGEETSAMLAVGIPEADVLAESQRLLFHNLVLLSLVALAAIALAWFLGDAFVLRQVKSLVATTKQLEAGNLTVRSGFRNYQGELGQLAHALDEMAAGLEQRAVERQRAAGALRSLNTELERRVAERTEELAQKNAQMSADLEMAREFQFAFLPHRYPSFPAHVPLEQSQIQFRHLYRPSGSVGGDFFDILAISDTQAGILICDVMGHGVRAALVTALIRGLVEDLRPVAADPGVFLTEINRTLVEVLRQTGRMMFVSAFYLVVDTITGDLTYATAGHPSALHIRVPNGDVAPVAIPKDAVGPVLGLFPDVGYQTSRAQARRGDTLLFFTDGVYEMANAANEVFTYERFETVVRRWARLPVATLFDELMLEVQEFAGSQEFRDDICLIAAHLPRADRA